MRQVNFDKEMQKIINENVKKAQKPKLLMHACCAPCSTNCIERVKDYFDLTIYFYNPNMDSQTEYDLRLSEQKRYCEQAGVKIVFEEYSKQDFLSAVKGLEDCLEGGKRCFECFYLRLNKTAQYAKENGYEYFTTTLTVSPLKNAKKINDIGGIIAEKVGVKFLPSDFKKNNGYLRSVELSKQFSLYRQNYCGCEFSKGAVPKN